jgi:glutathione S-transferase
MTAELLGLPYSPWSEKARFALDARRVPYAFRLYQPLLGEPALRAKTKQWTGRVTVPVLTDDEGRVYTDSADIARWADQRGEGPTLFPEEHAHAIDAWIVLSERALSAWRALSLTRMLDDHEALAEMVPRGMRGLAPVAWRIGWMGIRRTLRKYDAAGGDRAEDQRIVESALDRIREATGASTDAPRTLLGRFTFADIAMAQVVLAVEPPAVGLKIGRASRRSFSDPSMKERFADVVAWRDALYARYRGVKA